MKINDTIFDVDLITVIDKLKSELAENDIHKFAKYYDSGEDIMLCCPYHKDGHERRPSAGIRKSDGLFHCLACGKTTSLCEMISDCLGYNDPLGAKGYKWLSKNFLSIRTTDRNFNLVIDRGNDEDKNKMTKLEYVSEEELDKYRYTHQYMYERGLTDNVIEYFDIGYDSATNSITFPVRDIDGNCLFVAKRNIDYKRFDLPRSIDKPLYGLYELSRVIYSGTRGKRFPDVYVCEGLFDCLRLWCNGKLAVAGFGCLLSDYQIKQLQDLPCRSVIIAFDNDKAGYDAEQKLRKKLRNKIIYTAILPQKRKDIGECTDDEIQHLGLVLV